MNRIIEADLKYCPSCNDEYRAEIVTCAACNVELLTGTQMLELEEQKQQKKDGRSMTLSPDDEMVSIRKGPVMQMKELQVLLERQGIPSLAIKDSSCGKGCCGNDLILQIRMSDVQEAMAFLEQDHVRSTALNEHDTTHAGAVFNTAAENATCPACGCSFPTTQAECPDCGLCFA
jgi:ferredoxin